MTTGYMVYCFKCNRNWVIEEDKLDAKIGFACEYCSTLGQLDMQQITCKVLDSEQIHNYNLVKYGLARVETF
jgi:DNA-directed RNA polymerase subunit RPC12/RpoP